MKDKNQDRKERYVGFYFNSAEDKQKCEELAAELTKKNGSNYCVSDIIRLAVKKYLETS